MAEHNELLARALEITKEWANPDYGWTEDEKTLFMALRRLQADLEAERKARKAAEARLAILDTVAPKITEMLAETIYEHQDPDSSQYNKCEKDQCQWCTTAEEVLHALQSSAPGQALRSATGKPETAPVTPAPAADHIETPNCGFDRTGSHTAGHYVCACGLEDKAAT